MTYNPNKPEEPKFKDSYKTPELLYQWPAYGNQIEKLDRQSIKWLTPKYCYAFGSVDTTIANWANWVITLTEFTTNDQRMSVTDDRITIPATWLYMVKALVRKSSVYVGNASIYIIRNWLTLIDQSNGLYEEVDFKSAADTSPITNMCVPLYLEQNDYIQIYIDNASGASCVYPDWFTTLRIISYILY